LIFLRASGDETTACHLEHKVWAAVADETASAMRYGFKGRVKNINVLNKAK
jgi:fucokinase